MRAAGRNEPVGAVQTTLRPDRVQLLDAKGNVREGVARERDVPAGFTPDVLATFEREPGLIDVVALHLLERHFAPGLHEESLEAVGLEQGPWSPTAMGLQGPGETFLPPPLGCEKPSPALTRGSDVPGIWQMTLPDWLTLLAIVLGPLFGVWLSRHLQDRAFRQERRMDVFRTLMRTRRTPMWPDHVGALNLVEIEFAEDGNVIDAWRDLFKHLGTPHARRSEETTSDSMNPEEIGERDRRYYARLGEERQRLLAKLLHAIAKTLQFKVEQLEIFEGGYTPQGWADIEVEQNVIRRFAARLAVGQSVLPIAVLDYANVAQAGAERVVNEGSEAA